MDMKTRPTCIYTYKTYIYTAYQRTHFRSKDTHRLKVIGWKKISHTNWNEKKAKVAVLISEKTDFKQGL